MNGRRHNQTLQICLDAIGGQIKFARCTVLQACGIFNELFHCYLTGRVQGQGVDLVWSTGAVPDDSQWQTILKEVERLRFHRPPGNLVREYLQGGTVKTEPADRTSVLFYFVDQDGRSLMMEIGAGRSIYTSSHTNSNLPIFLSGGEEAVQALVERLLLMEE